MRDVLGWFVCLLGVYLLTGGNWFVYIGLGILGRTWVDVGGPLSITSESDETKTTLNNNDLLFSS